MIPACQVGGPPPIVEPGPPVLRAQAERIAVAPSIFPASNPPASITVEVKLRGDLYPESILFQAEARLSYLSPDETGEIISTDLLTMTLQDPARENLFTGQFDTAALLDGPATSGGTIRQRLAALGADQVSLRLIGRILAAGIDADTPWDETNVLDSSMPQPEIVSLSAAAVLPGNTLEITVTGHNLETVTAGVMEGLAGLTVDSISGATADTVQISLTAASTAGPGHRTLRLLGSGGLSPVTQLARITVIDTTKPAILSLTLPAGNQGTPYSFQLLSSGGTGAVSWAFRSGSFPSGMTISSGGLLSGTPATAGTYVFDLSVRDQDLNEDRRTFLLTIAPPPGDGRDALLVPCDAFADSVAAQNGTQEADRATGAPDPVPAVLSGSQPPVVGLAPANLSLVSQLANGAYLLLDMGPDPCEWIQARPSRAADAWLDMAGPYRSSVLVWLSQTTTTLARLALAQAPNSGSIGSGRFALDAGSDGTLYRYVTIALNDNTPGKVDAVERASNDLLAPETYSPDIEILTGGVPQPNGNDLRMTLYGDDTQGGADPAGKIASFTIQLHNLTTGITEPDASAESANGSTAVYEATGLDDGNYEFSVYAVDLFSNADPAPVTGGFTIDTTGPELSDLDFTASSTVISTGGSVSLQVTVLAGDPLSGVAAVAATVSGPGGPYSFELAALGGGLWGGTLDDVDQAGAYTILVVATDGRSNTSDLAAGPVTLTANMPPAVDAGPDFSAPELTMVILDASGTSDPEGGAVTFEWIQTGGSPFVTIQGAGAIVSFFAPELLTNTPVLLTFQVTATDPAGASASDSVIVTITNVNQPPLVSAGPDVTIPDSAPYSLSGSAVDPEGDSYSLLWTQLSGPDVGITGQTIAEPSFNPPDASGGDITLIFQLTATDVFTASASDTVIITISTSNYPPVANAGPDQFVFDTTPLFIDGTASYDPEGGGLTYLWSMTTGNPAHIPGWAAVNKTTPTITLAAINAGTDTAFTFQLQVTDNQFQTHTDTVTVNVKRLCVQPVSLTSASRQYGRALDQAVDGELQFVLQQGVASLFYRDWAAGTRHDFALPGGAGKMMVHDTVRRLLWIAGDTSLDRVNLDDLSVTTAATLPAPALDIAVDTGTGRVGVLTSNTGGRLVFFDTTGGPSTGSVDLDRASPGVLSLIVSPWSGRFVVADRDNRRIDFVNPAIPAVLFDVPFTPETEITGVTANPDTGVIAVIHAAGITEVSDDGAVLVHRSLGNDPPSRYDAIYTPEGELVAVRGLGSGEATTSRSLYRSVLAFFTGSVTDLPDPGDVALNLPAKTPSRTGDFIATANEDEFAILEARKSGASRLTIVTGTDAPYDTRTIDLTNDEPLSIRAAGGRYYVLTAGGDLVRVVPGESDVISVDRPAAQAGVLAVDDTGRLQVTDRRARRLWQVAGQSPTITVSRQELQGLPAALVTAGSEPVVGQIDTGRSGGRYTLLMADGSGTVWSGPDSYTGTHITPPVTDGTRTYSYRHGQEQIEVYLNDTGILDRVIPVTISPVRLAVSPGGDTLAAIDPDARMAGLYRLDDGDDEYLIPTGEGPAELVFNGDGSRLIVRERATSRALVIDVDSAAAIAEHAIPVTNIPAPTDPAGIGRRSLAYHPASGFFYLSSGMNLLKLSGSGSSPAVITPVALLPITSLDVIGNYVAVTDGGRRVFLVSPSQNHRAFQINIPVTPPDGNFQRVAADPNGELLYVAGEHTVTVIDFRNGCTYPRPVNYAWAAPWIEQDRFDPDRTAYAYAGPENLWNRMLRQAKAAMRGLFGSLYSSVRPASARAESKPKVFTVAKSHTCQFMEKGNLP